MVTTSNTRNFYYRYNYTIRPLDQQTRQGLKGCFRQRGWQSHKPYQPV